MDYAKESLKLHAQRRGKIEVRSMAIMHRIALT